LCEALHERRDFAARIVINYTSLKIEKRVAAISGTGCAMSVGRISDKVRATFRPKRGTSAII